MLPSTTNYLFQRVKWTRLRNLGIRIGISSTDAMVVRALRKAENGSANGSRIGQVWSGDWVSYPRTDESKWIVRDADHGRGEVEDKRWFMTKERCSVSEFIYGPFALMILELVPDTNSRPLSCMNFPRRTIYKGVWDSGYLNVYPHWWYSGKCVEPFQG